MVRHVLECVPPHEWPTRVEALDVVLRRLEAARKDKSARRGATGGRTAPRAGCHPASRHGLAALSHDPARRRPDRGPVRLPRFHQELAWLVQAHPGGAQSPAHSSARLAAGDKEQEWSDPESGTGLCWDPIRPLLGLGDWLDRVVWKGDVEPAKARSARVVQAPEVVPVRARTAWQL